MQSHVSAKRLAKGKGKGKAKGGKSMGRGKGNAAPTTANGTYYRYVWMCTSNGKRHPTPAITQPGLLSGMRVSSWAPSFHFLLMMFHRWSLRAAKAAQRSLFA
jgi:hypothetical protein